MSTTSFPRLNESAPDFKAKTTHGDRSLADPHWGNALEPVNQPVAPPALFPEVPGPCRSFSQYWSRVTKGSRTLADLLERTR